MRTPDFFIVGAPKCGTTAMYEWLQAHPDVFVPVKEIHYFGRDLAHRRPEVSAARYAELYEGVGERIAGDVAVWYLLSESAAEEIHALNPDARIIIMLRRPAEMLHSLHSQLVYSGDEDIEDFEEALAADLHGYARVRTAGTARRNPPLEAKPGPHHPTPRHHLRVASAAMRTRKEGDQFSEGSGSHRPCAASSRASSLPSSALSHCSPALLSAVASRNGGSRRHR